VTQYDHPTGERVLADLPLGICVMRAPTGEVLYTNQAYHSMLGIAPGESLDLGDAVFRDGQGNLVAEADLPFRRALAEASPVVVDKLVIHRSDGGKVWLRAFANRLRDGQGAPTDDVVVAFTDITAEVHAVVERAEIEKHLEVAIQHAPVLLFTLDRQGVLTAADGALLAWLNRGGHGMVGVSILEAYKNHPTVPGNVRRALAGETVLYSIEVQGLSLDVWLGPIHDASGTPVGAIGVCTDVSETKRLQSRIIHDDRLRAMGTVAATVAHEINNPLTYVLTNLAAAKHELDALIASLASTRNGDPAAGGALERAAQLREYLGPVLVGTERIREVTRELSTFTRRDEQQSTSVDIPTVVRSVLKLTRKEIEAHARLVEELGSAPLVAVSEPRLAQVLFNLLTNAWQALPEPDPPRHVIGIRTAAEDGGAVIEVWDSGPGIPPGDREHVFEPFMTTKEIGKGTGLGLFVCRNIISSLEGRISIHDAPSGGALFRVFLPAAIDSSEASAAPPVSETKALGSHPLRILIIDDDFMVARALASQLEGHLFDARIAVDGRRGLEILLTDQPFDLAYCDIMMQGFTGIDVYEALERQAPHRLHQLVFMTGGAFTARAKAFLDQRRNHHVEKPFDIAADARQRVSSRGSSRGDQQA
jgi:signal transduction histidine kinase/ActR/RegA family two-component response regulator